MNPADIRQTRPEEWHALMLEFLQRSRENPASHARQNSADGALPRIATDPAADAAPPAPQDSPSDRLLSRRALLGRLKPSASVRGRS